MGRRIDFFLRRSSSELYPHLVEHRGYLRKGCWCMDKTLPSMCIPPCLHPLGGTCVCIDLHNLLFVKCSVL